MIKYWFKNRLIMDLLVSIALSFFVCFVFIYTPNNAYIKNYEENMIYIHSEIDYQIPNPSVQQIKDIEDEEFIEDTFAYYLTKTNVTGKNTSKVNLMMTDNISSLSITMFNESTLIDSIINTVNYAYIDEVTSSKLDVNCGDEITINILNYSLKYVVCKVYDENKLFADGTIVVQFKDKIKEIYETAVSSNGYSGAFIKSSNDSQCNDFLKSYVPLGRLKERSEFDSDEAFHTYNNAIMSGNYTNEITNFSELRDSALKINNRLEKEKLLMTILGASIGGIIHLVISQVLRRTKSEDKCFKEIIKNKITIKKYRICTFVFSTIFFSVFIALLLTFIKSVNVLLVVLLISTALYFVTMIVNIIQDRKYLIDRG